MWWFLLLCVHLLTFSSSGFVFGALCPGNQSSLLLKLKPGFPSGSRPGSWIPGSDCCLWEGVTCDNTTGLITGLDLSTSTSYIESIGGKIDPSLGKIDPSLFELQSLRILNLGGNNFIHSSTLYGLEQLTNLTHLNLSRTFFNGQVPLQLYHLTRLVSLDLSDGSFLEIPDLKTFLHNLTALQQLYLNGINMPRDTSDWSQTISSALPHLRELSLEGCELSGPIQASLLQLPFLTKLNLASNNLSLLTADSFSTPSSMRLRYLDLSNCQLELGGNDQLLKKIFQLPNLHSLDLSLNNLPSFPSIPPNNNVSLRFLELRKSLNGTLPKSIFNLKFLNYLDLSNGFVSGEIPEDMGFLKFSKHSDLSYKLLTGGIPEKLGDLKLLKHLDLSLNDLTGGIPEKLGDLKLLNYMDLSSNNLSGGIPRRLGDLKFLKYLDLSSNNLSGGIPRRLGDLKFLKFLDLSSNNLSGEIPKEIRRLKFLSYLDLSNNTLKGTIPSFLLGLLPTLQELHLANNLFNGSLSDFTNPASSSLATLDLSNNRLSGQIPSSIAYLAQLSDLILSSNNFSGTVYMGMFRSLMNLSILDLSDNSFTVDFNYDSIGNNTPLFSGLAVLLLRSCNMSGFWWFFLSNQTGLYQLDLSNNRIHGAIPNWIGQLTYLNLSHNLLTSFEQPVNFSLCYLQTLDLHDNMLEGSPPIPPTANFLDYSFNRFASMIPADIGRNTFEGSNGYFTDRYFLSLSNNKLMGEIPLTICYISSFLEILDMSNNRLTDSIPRCLTNTTRMSILSLGGNDLHGNIPDGFVQTSSLRTLDLNSNQFSGPIPRSLINCTKLEVLDLGNNHLNDTFPSWLENLPRLYVLALHSNQFHGMIKPNQIRGGFQRLQIIDLSTNKFTGNLPVEYFRSWKFIMEGGQGEQEDPRDKVLGFEDVGQLFYIHQLRYEINVYYQDTLRVRIKRLELMYKKILTIFTFVDLSNNKFDGRIPAELGNLKFLVALNLSLNNLYGQIPSSLGNLSWVESMDLSRNSLSGEIPLQLASLNFLAVLDLSQNRLTGRIPEGAQFSTFTNASFEGNLGLCGPPLSVNCTRPSPPMEPTNGEATMHHEVDKLDFIIAGILGFFCGITLVIWPLLFPNKWRRWYYGCVDKVLMWLSYYLCCM